MEISPISSQPTNPATEHAKAAKAENMGAMAAYLMILETVAGPAREASLVQKQAQVENKRPGTWQPWGHWHVYQNTETIEIHKNGRTYLEHEHIRQYVETWSGRVIAHHTVTWKTPINSNSARDLFQEKKLNSGSGNPTVQSELSPTLLSLLDSYKHQI